MTGQVSQRQGCLYKVQKDEWNFVKLARQGRALEAGSTAHAKGGRKHNEYNSVT